MFSQLPLAAYAQRDEYEGPPINYSTAEVNDPVAKLARKVDSGELELNFDDRQGYLPAVLKLLDIPVSSQTLVFSKTSMQRSRISPRRPRAIYFNDEVYVGFCQNGGVIEFAATDPKQGATFYTLEQSLEAKPQFIRDQGQCLTCHSSSRTQNVPGYLIRSVFTNAGGMPEFGSGTFTTSHTSPFRERWGGWYVTGTHGDMRHMGNAIFNKRDDDLDRDTHANLQSLDDLVSTAPYPSPHSDIVALMVMEHQTQMHNAIAWANYETRRAIHHSESMNEVLERPKGELSESAERRIHSAADRVLEYLLMCDEFPLTSPVKGTSDFATEFERRGVRDSQGRSLRDFDLVTRMFRYPCSYMIYSDAFDGLPDQVRRQVLSKLKHILAGDVSGEDADQFAHLSEDDCYNIRQILMATKPEFSEICKGKSHDNHNDTDG
ncbi:MAG: hypothetical protein R3C59_21460 [Planctomycetaceae bacterium]